MIVFVCLHHRPISGASKSRLRWLRAGAARLGRRRYGLWSAAGRADDGMVLGRRRECPAGAGALGCDLAPVRGPGQGHARAVGPAKESRRRRALLLCAQPHARRRGAVSGGRGAHAALMAHRGMDVRLFRHGHHILPYF